MAHECQNALEPTRMQVCVFMFKLILREPCKKARTQKSIRPSAFYEEQVEMLMSVMYIFLMFTTHLFPALETT